MEGDSEPILRARLRNVDGDFEDRDINLTERIMNRDGRLCFGRFWMLAIPLAQRRHLADIVGCRTLKSAISRILTFVSRNSPV